MRASGRSMFRTMLRLCRLTLHGEKVPTRGIRRMLRTWLGFDRCGGTRFLCRKLIDGGKNHKVVIRVFASRSNPCLFIVDTRLRPRSQSMRQLPFASRGYHDGMVESCLLIELASRGEILDFQSCLDFCKSEGKMPFFLFPPQNGAFHS